MSLLPKPDAYPDWKAWGSKLIGALSRVPPAGAPILPAYNKAQLPVASIDGILIFVNDDVGGKTVAFSAGGVWKRTSDNATIS